MELSDGETYCPPQGLATSPAGSPEEIGSLRGSDHGIASHAEGVGVDPEHGVGCATHSIRSTRGDVAQAVADLAARERAPRGRIGWADAGGRGAGRMPEVVAAVGAWCAERGWAAAVWTDLEPNFRETTGAAFTVAEGVGYLRTLPGTGLDEARRYIRQAPATTRTPLRRALACDPWWRGLRAQALAASSPSAPDLNLRA